MTREQKILMKFDQNNIIDGEVSSESGSGEEYSDIDDLITTNL